MKILLIQGSRRDTDDNGQLLPFERSNLANIMEEYGIEVITPVVRWYSDKNLFNTINIEFLKHDIDGIVGNSAGGYMAYYFSNYYNVPALLLNPAIASSSEAPTIQKIPESFLNAEQSGKQLVVLGNSDLKKKGGVDFNLVIDFLTSKSFINYKDNRLFIEQSIGHHLPADIFSKYFKKFINYYLK